jgi:hypothetical protein
VTVKEENGMMRQNRMINRIENELVSD